MSENQLIFEIVRRQSELFPLKRGQFFHIANERNNRLQAIKARSMGIFPGVADFFYFCQEDGQLKMLALELKAPGTWHQKNHIQIQLEWAEIFEREGGTWRLIRSVEEAISCLELNYKGLTIEDVRYMMELDPKKKSIQF